ncbi:hypothetical protein [Isoptericola sp. NPDC056578]|uniref:hypothetical protein n=1 Tax=unclassified Isoptericola TaxID=2623355 RepID=UPI00369DEC33
MRIRPGVLAGVGLAVLVAATVVLFTVRLPEGVELALQGVWIVVVVVLCWGTARSMGRRQRTRDRVRPDGAGESGPAPQFDRRSLLGQDKQPPHLR